MKGSNMITLQFWKMIGFWMNILDIGDLVNQENLVKDVYLVEKSFGWKN